ncbi:MAG: Spy/CpxP family protein refolding chaperone [Pseudomonadota bacterium]
MSNETNTPESEKPKRGKRIVIALVAGAAIAAGSVFTVQAIAQTTTYKHIRLLTADSGNAETIKASWGRRGGFSSMTDSEIEAQIKRGVAHLAIEIDATDAQQQEIIAIVTPAVLAMKDTRQEMRETGQEFAELLTAPVVDSAAVEALRAEKLVEVEQMSQEWTSVLTQVAMVLTPEQRETVAQRLEQLQSMRRWRR